ncbi:chromatin complexes subunit BAP18 isoform X4 [Gallus gallus]|uniref:chromatin complexes subunit BAP18 isoform X4 n=1 Tax=Gallus gallus TaxID=9031 RepID=UPI001AE3C763|nr:chromatin complexes subunit BAP18 isoform X4 [Gallus gallus]
MIPKSPFFTLKSSSSLPFLHFRFRSWPRPLSLPVQSAAQRAGRPTKRAGSQCGSSKLPPNPQFHPKTPLKYPKFPQFRPKMTRNPHNFTPKCPPIPSPSSILQLPVPPLTPPPFLFPVQSALSSAARRAGRRTKRAGSQCRRPPPIHPNGGSADPGGGAGGGGASPEPPPKRPKSASEPPPTEADPPGGDVVDVEGLGEPPPPKKDPPGTGVNGALRGTPP